MMYMNLICILGKLRVKHIIYKNTPVEDKDSSGHSAYPGARYYKGDLVVHRVIPYVYDLPGYR
ncbi:hypothetical protein EON63_00160 [archaeon]|nr:MAG: hypothetical protein EON63_00160 [archaeon]